jgi:starch phosphorylase
VRGVDVWLNNPRRPLEASGPADQVIPLYYQRDRDALPRAWIKRMKRTIRTLGWRFNANRMVMDYTLKCYIPAAGGTSSDMRRTM